MIGLSSSSDHNHCVLQNVSYQKERRVTLPLPNKYISASKLRSQKWSSKVYVILACHSVFCDNPKSRTFLVSRCNKLVRYVTGQPINLMINVNLLCEMCLVCVHIYLYVL